jgi:hypothetical protein
VGVIRSSSRRGTQVPTAVRIVSLIVAFVAGFGLLSTGVRYVTAAIGLSAADENIGKPKDAARQRPDLIVRHRNIE